MKKNILRILALMLSTLFLTCSAYASSFPDVDDDEEYVDAVEYMSEIGLMVGDTKGNFNPNKAVSRAEMATILCRLVGEADGATTSTKFTDVPTTYWANKYITKAAELGIVGGYGNGKFGPTDTVKYEQALAMIIRAMGQSEYAQSLGGYPDGIIAASAELGYTNWISAEKGDLLTRWQVAAILYNVVV